MNHFYVAKWHIWKIPVKHSKYRGESISFKHFQKFDVFIAMMKVVLCEKKKVGLFNWARVTSTYYELRFIIAHAL